MPPGFGYFCDVGIIVAAFGVVYCIAFGYIVFKGGVAVAKNNSIFHDCLPFKGGFDVEIIAKVVMYVNYIFAKRVIDF